MMKKVRIFVFALLAVFFCFAGAAAQKELIDLSVINIDPITNEYIPEEEVIRRWEEQNGGESFSDASQANAQNVSTVYSLSDFVISLRSGFAAHLPTIEIRLYTNDDINDLTEYVEQALKEHTGVPNEGDYIYMNYNGMTYGWSYSWSDDPDYNAVLDITITVAYYHDRAQETAATKEFENVYKSLKPEGTSDIAKIRAVFDYMSKNVRYDFAHLNDSSYKLKFSSYAAIVQKSAVCQGFATSVYRLLLMYGIDVRVVTSIPSGNHAWNIVKIGDKWYHLDATWASNSINDNNNPEEAKNYFMRSSANIRNSDSSDGEHQMDYQTQTWLNNLNFSDEDYYQETEEQIDPIMPPEIVLTGPKGTYTLDTFSGDAVVLVFGRTTCMNTQALLSTLNERKAEFLSSNIHVAAIMDDAETSADLTEIQSMYPDFIFTYSNGYALWDYLQAVGYNEYSVTFPCVFVIDAYGSIIYWSTGFVYNVSSFINLINDAKIKYTATVVNIQDTENNNITEKTITVSSSNYQVKASAIPARAPQKFSWASNDPSLATVNSAGNVAFKKAGTVTITASATDGSRRSAWVRLNYDPITASIIIKNSAGTNVNGKTLTINSSSYQLTGAATPVGVPQTFNWTSNNTGIATVDANGKVLFKTGGTVTITAAAIDGSGKSAWVKLTYMPLATSVAIQNSGGTVVTGKTVVLNSPSYQLKAVASPAIVAQKFTWTSNNTGIAMVDANGKVTFKSSGTVTVTATAADGSEKSAWVKLTYTPIPPVLEIKDSNIRGKNKEIQIVIPWNSDLMKVECTLYNDETGQKVTMTLKERMDSTGKNKVVSYVGNPLVNGTVYRFKVRVYNGAWSNYVEKYAMPIANVFGATVVAGNKTMVINNQHREPTTGARYMLCDADTEKEIAYRVGTRTNTTWTYSQLTNGKLYYVVAVPYRDYKGQRLWGPNQMRIYFLPMGIPGNGKVNFTNNTTAEISIGNDSAVDGIRVLYRTIGGKLMNGCEGAGNKCRISGLNKNTAYEFYAMKYKMAQGKKYYSMGTLIPYKTALSGLKAPQNNPVVTMTNSGYTTFSIKKAAEADGISVLYREGEGAFQQACEKAGNSCSTTLSTTKNYTFYIMQYKVVSGKKLYSNGIVARDFSSGKSADTERLYTNFYLADESISQEEIAAALDDYLTEDAMLMAEAMEAMSGELMAKSAEEYEFIEDDDSWIEEYARFDSDVMAEKQAVPEPQPEEEKGPFSWLNFFFLGGDDNNREVPVPSFENK